MRTLRNWILILALAVAALGAAWWYFAFRDSKEIGAALVAYRHSYVEDVQRGREPCLPAVLVQRYRDQEVPTACVVENCAYVEYTYKQMGIPCIRTLSINRNSTNDTTWILKSRTQMRLPWKGWVKWTQGPIMIADTL
jgi:hypothetical protein